MTPTGMPLAARVVALGHARPDRRSVLFRPTCEVAVSEAVGAMGDGAEGQVR